MPYILRSPIEQLRVTLCLRDERAVLTYGDPELAIAGAAAQLCMTAQSLPHCCLWVLDRTPSLTNSAICYSTCEKHLVSN